MRAYKKTVISGVLREVELPVPPMDFPAMVKRGGFIAGYQQACLDGAEIIERGYQLCGRRLTDVLDRGPILKEDFTDMDLIPIEQRQEAYDTLMLYGCAESSWVLQLMRRNLEDARK